MPLLKQNLLHATQKMSKKPNIIKLVASIILLLFFVIPPNAFAHDGQSQLIGKYWVSIEQYPLSPFVDENEQISFDLETVTRKPAEGVKGKLIIKETTSDQFVGKESVVGSKIIHEEEGVTDASGSVGISYTFQKEGVYDIEYVWGDNEDAESAGLQIFVREPTSYFLPQELEKRIWLFIGIAMAGMAAGTFFTFVLLTTTLHPKR